MTFVELVQELCEILVAGVTNLGTGLASGVKGFVTALIYEGTGEAQTISSFMGIVVVFGAIGLAVGLTTLIFNWIKNIGA